MAEIRQIVSKQEMLRILCEGIELGPLRFELEPGNEPRPDGVLRACSDERGLERRFVFECQTEWTRRGLEQIVDRLRSVSKPCLPLVIFPYLSGEQLAELRALRISGLDLSGNGLILDPPRLFVLCTGAEKQFKASSARSSIYQSRNVATLIPRVFLAEPFFPTVKAVHKACQSRMMVPHDQKSPLVLSTVSKALARLEDDLVLTRKGRELRLCDPDRLLSSLTRSFELPIPHEKSRFLGRTSLTDLAIWSRLNQLRPVVPTVVTGRGSAGRYTGLAGPERLQLYVRDIGAVVRELEARPTQAFPNLELIETQEEAPYFDAREHAGVLWSSPVQTYLELQRGDPRERGVSPRLHAHILEDIQQPVQ